MPNTTLTAGQIAAYAAAAGFQGPALVTAVAIALAESGGNTWAIDNDRDGSQDQGLWQINTVHASEFKGMQRDPGTGRIAAIGASTMFDPTTNANAAYTISGGGSKWTDWDSYTHGAYTAYVQQATAAVASSGRMLPRNLTPAELNGVYGATSTLAPIPTGTASASGFGYYLVDDHDPPIISTTPDDLLALTYQVPNAVIGLVVAGAGDIGPQVTGGTVELDIDQVGQITFTAQDPQGRLAPSLQLKTPVTYKGLRLVVAAVEAMPGGGGQLAWQITARVAVAQQMKLLRNPPTMPSASAASSGADNIGNLPGTATDASAVYSALGAAYSDGVPSVTSDGQATDDNGDVIVLAQNPVSQNPSPGTSITPTDYIAFWATKFGGTLAYGAPTYTQAVISPTPVTQGLPASIYGETLFDVVNRLATNYGYWFFDADGTNVWFGPPGGGALSYELGQGIVSRGTPFKVGWAGAWAGDTRFDAIEYPDCRQTTDDILTPATIVVKLPRGRGELVRPGMTMWLKGVPNFDAGGQGQQYVVTKVSWPMDSGQTPAQITAVTPINPVPTDIALLPAPLPPPANGSNGSTTSPYNAQYPLSPNTSTTHLAVDFVTLALKQIGKPYVWGAAGPSAFDCSGLVEWCAGQVGLKYPDPGQGGPRSQQMLATSAAAGREVPVATAGATRGALLFSGPAGSIHVAISLGDGIHTVEALNLRVGVVLDGGGSPGSQDNVPFASRFQHGALIPGMDYNTEPVLYGGS